MRDGVFARCSALPHWQRIRDSKDLPLFLEPRILPAQSRQLLSLFGLQTVRASPFIQFSDCLGP